ncbi:MAG: GGDEF domain-containing protein [Candidatus Omnitrophota bacterium]|nr:MAG: GGDEF domain-containing protein [Candidatus Omnitrophota bacterium]
MEDTKKLKEEVEKFRSQLYIFYELTKALRSTLRLDEIVYIILTGLTAHQGLAFNRAMLFLADKKNEHIKGFMGIGPMDAQEANMVWESIEEQKMDLYGLIQAYHRIKEGKKPRFMEFIQRLSFSFSPQEGFIYKALFEKGPLHVKENKLHDLRNDPLIHHLKLREFLISSLWIKGNPKGAILVDNYITKKPITDDDSRIFNMFVEQAQGAIENSQVFEDTLIKSHTDPLTDLWNHGYFQYQLDEVLVGAKSRNEPLSIMMIDLDNFKNFNDTYGHIEGDKVLKRVSAILRENCRRLDLLCRYGGEEFSLILPLTNKEDAYHLGERMRQSVAEEEIARHRFTVSIGIATFPQNAQEKEHLIKKADDALYQAKREGKNRVVLA